MGKMHSTWIRLNLRKRQTLSINFGKLYIKFTVSEKRLLNSDTWLWKATTFLRKGGIL